MWLNNYTIDDILKNKHIHYSESILPHRSSESNYKPTESNIVAGTKNLYHTKCCIIF